MQEGGAAAGPPTANGSTQQPPQEMRDERSQHNAAAQPDAPARSAPMLPWMRVPIAVGGGASVPLAEVKGLQPQLSSALEAGNSSSCVAVCSHWLNGRAFDIASASGLTACLCLNSWLLAAIPSASGSVAPAGWRAQPGARFVHQCAHRLWQNAGVCAACALCAHGVRTLASCYQCCYITPACATRSTMSSSMFDATQLTSGGLGAGARAQQCARLQCCRRETWHFRWRSEH